MSDIPLITDADGVSQLATAYMEAVVPDWDPSAGDPMSRIFSAVSVPIAYFLTLVANAIAENVVPTVGSIILQTPLFGATPATVTSTWTMVDNAGYTIPAGTQVGLTGLDGLPVGFEVAEDVTVPNGNTVTTAGEVQLVALVSGTAGNDLSGTASLLADSGTLAFVADGGVVTVGATDGGTDVETFDAYGLRINKIAKLVKISTVLPEDFALAATVLVPGVGRSVAINNYNADTDTTGEEKALTVVSVQTDGTDVAGGVLDDIVTLLTSLREDNFEAFAIDPTRTAIAVHWVGIAAPGVDITTAKTAGDAALQAFFDNATWGADPNDASMWTERPTVLFQDVSAALVNVPQLARWTTLTLNGATADITLTGPGGLLPTATITSTVTTS